MFRRRMPYGAGGPTKGAAVPPGPAPGFENAEFAAIPAFKPAIALFTAIKPKSTEAIGGSGEGKP